MTTNDKIELIAKEIIDQLQKSVASSYKPWISPDKLIPINISNNEKFIGNNALYLLNKQQQMNFKDNRWIFEADINKIEGAEIKDGENPCYLPFLVSKTETEQPKIMILPVYNVAQVNNLSLNIKENQAWNDIEVVEDLLTQAGVKIEHTLSDVAAYDFRKDTILMPTKEQFPSEGAYYNTLLHELQHWTGHEDRLNRLPSKNNEEYAREELVAEIGNMLLQKELGVKVIQANSQYRMKIKEELQDYLNNDPKEILPAVAKAQKSVDFIMQAASQKQDLQEDQQEKQFISLGAKIDKIISNFQENEFQNSNNNKQQIKNDKKGISR